MLFALAEKLGMTVGQLSAVLTPDELSEWRALWKIRREAEKEQG